MDDRRKWIEGGTHFRVGGDGPPLILVHGVGLDLTMWSGLVGALEPHFLLVRYDMLGHGSSAKPPGRRSLGDFVAQLDRLHDHLDIGPAAVAGFSMGGLVARGYAARHPDRVAKLVLMSTVFERSRAEHAAIGQRVRLVERDGIASIVDAAMARWFTPGFLKAHPVVEAGLRERLLSNDRHGYLEAYRMFANADAELGGDLENLACPMLVMTGDGDVGSTPAMARAMAARAPRAGLRIFPGHRHMGLVEDPAPVARALLDFLLPDSNDAYADNA